MSAQPWSERGRVLFRGAAGEDGPTEPPGTRESRGFQVPSQKWEHWAVHPGEALACRSSHSCSSSVGAIACASQCIEVSELCDCSAGLYAPRNKAALAPKARGRRSELPAVVRPPAVEPAPA